MRYLNPIPVKKVLPATLYDDLDRYIDSLGIEEKSARRKEFLIQIRNIFSGIICNRMDYQKDKLCYTCLCF